VRATEQLRTSADTDTPELDAQLLACHVLEISRSYLFAFPETPLHQTSMAELESLLERRTNAEPIAYIIGKREFWSVELDVAPGTLVPRADTEILVEKALAFAGRAPDGMFIDLGTGTGAIAIAVASELADRHIIAMERYLPALQSARNNLYRQSLTNVHLVQGCWLDAIADNTVAMVMSNPPYIASGYPHLDLLRHEPLSALVSGSTGLEDLEHIIAATRRAGVSGAPLIVEHGHQQGGDVRQLLLNYSYADVGSALDLAGNERISFGFVVKTSR